MEKIFRYKIKQRLSKYLFVSILIISFSFFEAASQVIPPVLTSPPDGSANLTLPVTLRWDHLTASSFHLQVASDASFNNLIVDVNGITSRSYQLNSLEENVAYYWRVRAYILLVGSEWSNVWSFSIQFIPETPGLVSPSNGSTINVLNPSLDWEDIANADFYRLQVAKSSSFNSNQIIFDDSTISGSSYQVGPLDYSTQYYWRVNARNEAGTSNWSAEWSFTTFADPNLPAPPVLVSPSNGDTGITVNPTLSWENSNLANSYRLQVSTDVNFTNTITDQNGLTTLSYTLNGLNYNTKFYWRVSASNSSGTSGWSSVWSFTTASQPTFPSVPVLVSPVNGTINESTYPILTWEESDNATSYRLQLAEDEAFSDIVFDTQSIPINYYQAGPLNFNTEYFWRVKANNSAGTSDWSVIWDFKTRTNDNTVPVMISPPDGSKNLPLSVVCTWNKLQNVQAYCIQVSIQPDFSSLFFIDSVITDNSRQVSNLKSNTTYFWRIKAKINNSWGNYSAPWQFTTRISSPSFITVDTTIFFPYHENISNYKSSDYRIVGIPGNSHVPVINFLSGNMGTDWRAFWDNGKPADYLVGYNQSDFIFSAGKAFWILKRGSMEISATVEESPLNNNGNAEITLHRGWNLITNPFNYPVNWDSVRSLNTISEPIYSFNGSYNISQMLIPFRGFYFFNSTNLEKIEIPPGVSINKNNKTNIFFSEYESINGWITNIKLSSKEYIDSVAWFGVSSLSQDNPVYLNIHKPRNWGSLPEIYFNRPEWDEDFPYFASDIKTPFNNLSEWSFDINASELEPVSLVFNPEDIPDHFEIYLYNTNSGRWVDIRKNPSYRFTPAAARTNFKIVVGKKNLIEDKFFGNEPQEFMLGDNYPNPFNLSTTIPVTIPQKSDVEITIYNLLGNKIKTLYKGTLLPGEHLFRWDGTDENGFVNASGVYFYHISNNSELNITKKMTLIK